MSDIETFSAPSDLLYSRQKEDVAKMRSSLLACSGDTIASISSKQALANITCLRVYHQISRIIRYLELMDKLENKLYEAIESTVDSADSNSPSTWMMLLKIQEKLQKQMIESHKLLQPYMELQDINVIDLVPDTSNDVPTAESILPAESRDKIRSIADSVLQSIQMQGVDSNDS